MMNLQAMLFAGGLAALVAGGAGMQLGKWMEKGACEKRVVEVQKAAARIIDAKDDEIRTLTLEKIQAQGEVLKVNQASQLAFEDLQKMLSADQVKRDAAAARVETAAKQAAANAKEAAAKSLAAREVILHVADQCARSGVPDDVVRMLNDILGTPAP